MNYCVIIKLLINTIYIAVCVCVCVCVCVTIYKFYKFGNPIFLIAQYIVIFHIKCNSYLSYKIIQM